MVVVAKSSLDEHGPDHRGGERQTGSSPAGEHRQERPGAEKGRQPAVAEEAAQAERRAEDRDALGSGYGQGAKRRGDAASASTAQQRRPVVGHHGGQTEAAVRYGRCRPASSGPRAP